MRKTPSMKSRLKKAATALVCGSLALSLFACSAPAATSDTQTAAPTSNEPITLSFYTYNYSAAQKPGVDEMIKNFEGQNPGIKIEVVPGMTDKIQADIAAGIKPDVIQLVFDALDYGLNNFGVQDINSIADAGELKDHLAGFEQATLEVAKTSDGKLMGLPYTFSTPVLFYNATMFEAAGLDPDAPPTTWAEVKEYSQKIKDATGNAGVMFGDWSTDWMWQSVIKSNGGSVLSADKKSIEFDKPAAVEAIKTWQDFTKSGLQPAVSDSAQIIEMFSTGKLGMLYFTSALQASLIKAAEAGGWELMAAKSPAYGKKTPVPVNSGSGLFICSEDAAKQQAAWKFIKYLTSDEGYTTITTKMGYPPLRPGIMDDERYLKKWAEENPLAQPNLEQLKVVTPWQSYPGNNYSQIVTIFMDACKTAVLTDADVEKTLSDAADQAQSLLP